MLADAYYALRQLGRWPGLTLSIVLTLALGIGATTAVFSVADVVLLRPLPYPKSDRLVVVRDELSKMGVHFTDVSYETFEVYRKSWCFERTAAFTEDDRSLIGSAPAERVSVLSSTSSLPEMLGMSTIIGRPFGKQDWTLEHNDVAILSYSLFASRFGANPDIIGRTIHLDDRLYTVIGVMAPGIKLGIGDRLDDIWVPLRSLHDPGAWQFQMLARMRPGIDISRAQSAISDAATHIEGTVRPYRGPNGEDGGYTARVLSLRNQVFGEHRTGSLLLSVASSLLLLIACVNVANLLLARAATREKEIAIRRALGASRWRLLRQWTTEAALLTTLGGAAGLCVGHWGVLLLKALSPTDLPNTGDIGIDGRVLLFTFLTSGFVCLVLSLAPALALPEGNLNLRGSRRGGGANWLVTVEVAIAIMLLIACGLLGRSLARLRQIDTGIRIDHLLTMQIRLSGPRYKEARQRIQFFSDLQGRLANLPGVISASEVDMLPVFTVGADTRAGNPFSLEGRPWSPSAQTKQMAHTITVGLNYFRTMGVRLRKGRDFSRSDVAGAPPVAIINETLERMFFPKGNPIGQHILFGAPSPGARWMTIIGLVSDVRNGALDLRPAPQFFMPQMQNGNERMFVVVRTKQDPASMSRAVLRVAHTLDPEQPADDISTMERHVDSTLGQPRFRTMLTSLFGLIALALAAVGIYGVVSNSVARRTREIGIRGALGADSVQIAAKILADGIGPIAVGIAIGCSGGAMLARLLASILYEGKTDDPTAFVFSVVLIGVIGAMSCLLPALRACRIDPAIALREE